VDPAICTASTPTPTGCGPQTVAFNDQRVAMGEEKRHAPITVAPGSRIEVRMVGDGPSAGDPDLYVRFGQEPQRSAGSFACRPYLTGSEESCSLDVPAGQTRAFVMVHGYTAGAYDLTVTYTAGP
jgi:hypothetical protein